MGKYAKLMGRYDAETTTYSACAGSGAASPYTPDEDGRLVGLRVITNAGAATNLVNGVQFKLTCTTFKPNSIEVHFCGGGLLTAPAFIPNPVDWPTDQAVRAGVPITIEARNMTADTPVGVDVALYGIFES